jgi:hypothetical protein
MAKSFTSVKCRTVASVLALSSVFAMLGGCVNGPEAAHPAVSSKPAVTLHPDPAFAGLPRYEGTLGKRAIVLRLGAKTGPDEAGGLHGEYQFVDTKEVRLVAGDSGDDGVIELDESDDGTRISGQWVGKLAPNGNFKGVWSNVDESVTESIELHRVTTTQKGQDQK